MTMDSFPVFLIELNLSVLILFAAYKLFFERDKNFVVRRIYLMGSMVLPFILALVPETIRTPVGRIAPLSFNLEEITITAGGTSTGTTGSPVPGNPLIYIYLLMVGFGIIKLIIQLWGILRAVIRSDRLEVEGTILHLNPVLHASSFFRYIFMDPDAIRENRFGHILDHEKIHKKEWHSIDRILVELFVIFNWFNPVAWLIRKSVIENLEYLADAAVVKRGTDAATYQLSLLNQYIGSASIANQFNNQIKKRINMLNKDYKLGSSWKLALIFPLVCAALIAISCTHEENKIYYEVDEMPTFNGEDPVVPFREYIAANLVYPETAKDHGITGNIYVKFVVRKDGTVELPTPEEVAATEGIALGEVVVVGYRPNDENTPAASEEDIEILKQEAIRVITSSPKWEPGKVDGRLVDVMFTFPINFVLQ
jgi:hypothetical protein